MLAVIEQDEALAAGRRHEDSVAATPAPSEGADQHAATDEQAGPEADRGDAVPEYRVSRRSADLTAFSQPALPPSVADALGAGGRIPRGS